MTIAGAASMPCTIYHMLVDTRVALREVLNREKSSTLRRMVIRPYLELYIVSRVLSIVIVRFLVVLEVISLAGLITCQE